jgi:hypothetical protein
MNDTNPAITSKFIRLIMAKSPEERLIMGCSMFDAAKQIIKDSIINKSSKITPWHMREEIFIRFYSVDFDKTVKRKILGSFRARKFIV